MVEKKGTISICIIEPLVLQRGSKRGFGAIRACRTHRSNHTGKKNRDPQSLQMERAPVHATGSTSLHTLPSRQRCSSTTLGAPHQPHSLTTATSP
eukprot:1148631-Pelagomonas_calceolata.AAC.5